MCHEYFYPIIIISTINYPIPTVSTFQLAAGSDVYVYFLRFNPFQLLERRRLPSRRVPPKTLYLASLEANNFKVLL